MLMRKIRLGDLLVQENIITKEDLQKAIEMQKSSPNRKRIGEILIEEGLVNEETIMQLLSKQLNIPINSKIEPNFLLLKKIPAKILEKYQAIPVKENPKNIEIAFVDPLDIEAQNTIARYLDKPIKVVISSQKEILKHINQLKNREQAYSIIEQMKKEILGNTAGKNDGESATMQFIKYIIMLSISKGASDIHIEADENSLNVRSRIDGFLQEVISVEKELFPVIVARIKLLSDLNISEKRKPQDGRFSMELNGNHFDFRVSTLPIVTGESIVFRILD